MIEALRDLRTELTRLRTALPRPGSSQVRAPTLKRKFRDIVDTYFRHTRQDMASGGLQDDQLGILDALMQQLLDFSNRSVASSTCKKTLQELVAETSRLEQVCLTNFTRRPPITSISELDHNIINTLSNLLPAAAASYEQATVDLQADTRLSWRGPATDLREALRETLDHLAPDADVEAQQGYRREPDTTGPTMKQKVKYVLSNRRKGRAATAPAENAAATVDELVGSFVRSVYTRFNVSTHTPTDKTEVIRVRDYVRVVLTELLEIPSR